MTQRRKEKLTLIVVFILPALIFYGLFVIYPQIKAFFVSFYRWSGFTAEMQFVGLNNFKEAFTDTIFWYSLKNNVFFTTFPNAIIFALALLFAALIAKGIKGSNIFRISFFFPNVMPGVVIAILWSFILNPSFGILNGFLRLIGLEKFCRAWLDADHLILSLTLPLVWCTVGFYMVLFVAAIQNIPATLFEAAYIEGASEWQTFWHITFPLIWEMNKIAVTFMIIGGLKIFELIWVITYGYPPVKTHTMATYMYQKAFVESRMGYGTALSIIMTILIVLAVFGILRIMHRKVVEY